MDTTLNSTRIQVSDDDLDDLRRRLDSARYSDELHDAEWSDGMLPSRLRELVDRWRTAFDWRAVEADLNTYEQVTTEIDGATVHSLLAGPDSTDHPAILLLHGWPSTVAEFRAIIGPLSSPTEDGMAFDVVAPSLPGFGFSGSTSDRGWNQDRMADALDELMRRLGHDRYVAHGGDVGYEVATSLARRHPDRVAGIHLNLGGIRGASEHRHEEPLTGAEREAFEKHDRYIASGSAYAIVQATRPQTIADALTDSPVGQLAWVAEKFHEWVDPEHPIAEDDILAAASIYWFTRTAGSSARFYQEVYGRWDREPTPIPVPASIQCFPYEIVPPIRRWAEERYTVVRWVDMPAGGHFSALETPDLVVDSLREFAGSLR